jgi:hypothetical protein
LTSASRPCAIVAARTTLHVAGVAPAIVSLKAINVVMNLFERWEDWRCPAEMTMAN